MKVPSAPKWRLLQWFFISIFEKGETTSESSEVIWNRFIHFILKLFFLGRFKYSQVRCLELAPPWKGRSPGPHPWHPPLPGKLQLDSNRWMECQFTWNQVNYKWTGPMWVQVNRSSEKKHSSCDSNEKKIKWNGSQVKGLSNCQCVKWRVFVKQKVGQVKAESSEDLAKWKVSQVQTLSNEKVGQVITCFCERSIKWILCQVKGWSSECLDKYGQFATPPLLGHESIYIYIHINIWIDTWRKMPPGSFPRHLLPWESAPLQVETPNHEATMEVLGLCKWSLKWELKRSSFYVKRSSEIPSKVPSESQNPSWNVGIKWSVKQKSSENWNGMVTCRGPVKCQVTWQMQVETELAQT